jgi:dTMP kinase
VFVTLEGLDGVGKTTQARLLAARLRDAGREVVECREPGGTPLGEELRVRVLHGAAIDARAEALLFAAARAELVARVIRPALERGAWVVCDRFLDSSVAYQGGGRGLGRADVRAVSVFATGGLLPHRTLLLVGPRRLDDERDRIEAEGDRFADAVAGAFSALAEDEPDRVRRVDASGAEEDVAERVWEAVDA